MVPALKPFCSDEKVNIDPALESFSLLSFPIIMSDVIGAVTHCSEIEVRRRVVHGD